MTAQGIVYNLAAIPYVVPLFDNAIGPPVLHLFTSDSTPTVTDVPLADYQEAFGPNYSPQVVGPGFIQALQLNPPIFGLLGVAFPNVGPLSAGDDTVFGWWIDSLAVGPSAQPVCGGRFETPIVLNMAGQSVFFDVIELPFHDCGTSVPLQSFTLLDYFETSGAVSPSLHTPLIGSPYSVQQGSWTVFNRAVTCTALGINGFALVMTPSGTGDGYLRADWQPGSRHDGLVFRGSDSANFWAYGPNIAGSQLQLWKFVNNAGVPLVTLIRSFPLGGCIRLEVILEDDTITCYTDGGNSIQLTGDSFNVTAGMVGFWSTGPSTSSARSIIFTPAIPG